MNKARLFNANLAKNLVLAGKIIPILVDFAEKMKELLDEMRVLFNGLQPEVPPIAAENLPDISREIPSLTGWGKEAAPTETPTKPDQPGPFEPTREEEVPARPEHTSPSRRHTAEPTIVPKEVSVNMIVAEVVRELEVEQSQAYGVVTTPQPAWIDTMQTRPKEPVAERMRELPMLPTGPTPEPITLVTPRPLVRPSFLSQLERITQSSFKTLGPILTIRLPVSSPTPASTGLDTHDKPEASGSGRSAEGGAKTTSLAA